MAVARCGTLPLRSMTVVIRGMSPFGGRCGSGLAIALARALALAAVLALLVALALLGVPAVSAHARILKLEVALATELLQFAISN